MENNLNKVITFINNILNINTNAIIAIDGRCGSGKTTLSKYICGIIPCKIIHMDDFFLPPDKRTAERLSIPGENLDWERLEQQVLIPYTNGVKCSYNKYDCHSKNYSSCIDIIPHGLLIAEGTYSLNCNLKKYYDGAVMLSISPEEQIRRIIAREGEKNALNFKNKWIPLEEKYFLTNPSINNIINIFI